MGLGLQDGSRPLTKVRFQPNHCKEIFTGRQGYISRISILPTHSLLISVFPKATQTHRKCHIVVVEFKAGFKQYNLTLVLTVAH